MLLRVLPTLSWMVSLGIFKLKWPSKTRRRLYLSSQWRTLCYKVMSFRLKNVRATHQRAMVTLFHDMMHKKIRVYINDMIAKSKKE